jgi:hypothetical protein
MYCPPIREQYVPEYCYKDSPIWAYISNKSWNFRDSFIERALYIWDDIFWISNKKITANRFSDFSETWELELK